MHLTSRWKRSRLGGAAGAALAVALSFSMAFQTPALACTQVYVGPELTDTGDVYVGRAEDYASRHPKSFGIQEPRTNPSFTSGESDFSWTYDKTTYRYTYVRDTPSGWDNRTDAYSEAGTNEKGVSVSATLTTDYNKEIAAVDPCGSENEAAPSGLGEYSIADIVLGCSPTAREGVKLLGRIIDEHGSYDCNQIIIADNNETWLFSQLSGHQWIAINLTAAYPDKASVNPNIGQLKYHANLSDENTCLHSAKIVEVATQAGTATYFDDGSFDVATSYGAPNPGNAQYTRLAQGRAYFGSPLSDGTYTLGENGVASLEDPQLFFTSGTGKVSLFSALRSFAARGEQTSDLNANSNPMLYAIGNNRTVETHLYQIRRGMSPDIATIQWESLSRTEFSIAIPSYSALLTEVDASLYPAIDAWDETHTGAGESKDSVEAAMDATTDNGSLDYVMMDINTLAYNNREKLATNTRAYLDALQKQLIAQQATVDQVMQDTDADDRTELANRLHDQASNEVYEKTKTLLDEMRAYLSGDQSAPFVPSDYDEATGFAKTPIFYATSAFAPSFSIEPADVTVEQGQTGVQLSAKATIPDGIEGSDSKLAYEWFEDAKAEGVRDAVADAALDRSAPTPVGTGATLDIDTTATGSRSYYCVATNTVSNQSAVSVVATVTVSAKQSGDKPDAPNAPNTTDDASQVVKKTTTSVKKGSGRLPQTSDATNLMLPFGLAAAGLALVGVAVSLRSRRSED